jgi:hypothetical protein
LVSPPYCLYYDKGCTFLTYLQNFALANQLLAFAQHLAVWLLVLVDAFHFAKHQSSDVICQTLCNPNDSQTNPELFDFHPGEAPKRKFNTNAAEQTNSWFEGYGNKVKEMHPFKHDFFLDLWCLVHNEQILYDK